MSRLLLLTASPRDADSITASLAESFVARWLKDNPGGIVVRRDLGQGQAAGPDQAWIVANMTPPDDRSDEQNRLLAQSDKFIDDLHQASHVVIATPMYNFSLPWTLKAWIDTIVRAGKTFSFSPEAGFGPLLASDKKLLLIWSSAGVYAAGTPFASFDFLTPYIRGVFAFLGIGNFTEIAAGNQFAPPEIASQAVETAREQLIALAQKW